MQFSHIISGDQFLTTFLIILLKEQSLRTSIVRMFDINNKNILFESGNFVQG